MQSHSSISNKHTPIRSQKAACVEVGAPEKFECTAANLTPPSQNKTIEDHVL